jgi:Tol biopolymer transport system component
MTLLEHGSNQMRDLSWLSYSWGPRLSQDGSEVLFTDLSEQSGNEYSVYVRKSDGSPAIRLAGGGFGSDLSPDGKWALVVLSGDPLARVQVVPVGAGQARVLHWDGLQPRWAEWFPDGRRILLLATPSGKGQTWFVTDVNGATPKELLAADVSWHGVAPDGKSFTLVQNGVWVMRSISDGTSKPIAGIPPEEFPIGWALDGKHMFVQEIIAEGLNIYKVDINSGHRELWQAITPKDAVGLRPMSLPTAITLDGRWMAFGSRTQLGQLYRSDTLK